MATLGSLLARRVLRKLPIEGRLHVCVGRSVRRFSA